MKQQTISYRGQLFCMLTIATALITSCTTVKEYQKNKLNDAEMTLSGRKVERTELNFQSYREGASGANGGKTGGGCGCN
ncbi:MAG TPA: DUF4266 domain-containing protein [Parafilimonas sp.]|nr:DUF4266 domain-containing protein [Parafilimonas sp.]